MTAFILVCQTAILQNNFLKSKAAWKLDCSSSNTVVYKVKLQSWSSWQWKDVLWGMWVLQNITNPLRVLIVLCKEPALTQTNILLFLWCVLWWNGTPCWTHGLSFPSPLCGRASHETQTVKRPNMEFIRQTQTVYCVAGHPWPSFILYRPVCLHEPWAL